MKPADKLPKAAKKRGATCWCGSRVSQFTCNTVHLLLTFIYLPLPLRAAVCKKWESADLWPKFWFTDQTPRDEEIKIASTRRRLTFNEELLQSWLQREGSERIQIAPPPPHPPPWNHLFKYAEAFVLQGLGLNNLNFAWGQEQDFQRLPTVERPPPNKVWLNNKCLINGSMVLRQIPQHKHKIYIWGVWEGGVTRGNKREGWVGEYMHPCKMYKR